MPEALAPAFEIVRLGTRAEGAELIVERVPLGGTCRACREPFTTEEPFMLACPACGSGDFAFESGRELDIVDIEVD
jgi:hydrogenase nickel incorporation protein HypA/HybF